MASSEREREFTSAKNRLCTLCAHVDDVEDVVTGAGVTDR